MTPLASHSSKLLHNATYFTMKSDNELRFLGRKVDIVSKSLSSPLDFHLYLRQKLHLVKLLRFESHYVCALRSTLIRTDCDTFSCLTHKYSKLLSHFCSIYIFAYSSSITNESYY